MYFKKKVFVPPGEFHGLEYNTLHSRTNFLNPTSIPHYRWVHVYMEAYKW